jgi:hypothetical protein
MLLALCKAALNRDFVGAAAGSSVAESQTARGMEFASLGPSRESAMTSAVPYFAEPREKAVQAQRVERASGALSLTQTLGATGFIVGAVGGASAGLDVFSGQGQIEATFLWALLAASAAITFVLGSIEARILDELRKPLDR